MAALEGSVTDAAGEVITEDLIAYQGELELMNAKWELSSGRTVEFRLIETDATVEDLNPFKEYQKRRNGHVGQRFHGAVVLIGAENPMYAGEMMLAGWADTERGKTVKFWLDHEAAEHPFAGLNRRSGSEPGSLFMGVFVVLNCDSSAVNQRQQAIAEGKKPVARKFSAQIHLMVTSALFCQFLTERSQKTATIQGKGLAWHSMYKGEMMSRAYVKSVLGIESLSQLDTDTAKAEQFHNTFRRPFARWNGGDRS